MSWAGDCCSLPKNWYVEPFQKSSLEVFFDTSSFGASSRSKTVGLRLTGVNRDEMLTIPFELVVPSK